MNSIPISRYNSSEMHEMCDYCKNKIPHLHYYGDKNGLLQALTTTDILLSEIPEGAKVRDEGKWVVGPRPDNMEDIRKAFKITLEHDNDRENN